MTEHSDTSNTAQPLSSTPPSASTANQFTRLPGTRKQIITITRDGLIFAITIAATAVSSAVGVAYLSALTHLLLGGTLAAIALAITHALTAPDPTKGVAWWRRSTILALLLPVGIFAYQQWFDPQSRLPLTYQLVVNGPDTTVIPLYGEAGGEPQRIQTGFYGQNGLIGGQTYDFECWVNSPAGEEWLRYHRFDQTWWAPRALLHAPGGLPNPEIRPC